MLQCLTGRSELLRGPPTLAQLALQVRNAPLPLILGCFELGPFCGQLASQPLQLLFELRAVCRPGCSHTPL